MIGSSDPRAGDHAIDLLQQAGHDVVRCHDRDLGAFPCNALVPGGACAVEDDTLDVALVVRSHPWPRPTPLEDGVSCALRHHLPVVVAGRTILNPYEPWCSAVFDGVDDAIGALEQISRAPLPRLGRVLAGAVAGVLDQAGYHEEPAVEARRSGRRRLQVVVRTARTLDADTVDEIVVAVHRVANRRDPYAPGVDVDVRTKEDH